MSGRLDQSLDSIIDSQKKAKRDQHRRRRPGKAKVAPVGGVKKSAKPAKPAVKGTGGASAQPQANKIVVSGLPRDVNEGQIKEYFGKQVGIVKKVSLQYNHKGESRGIADIIFGKPGLATKAAKSQNGTLVDGRPMKIEVVVDAKSVPEPTAFADRVTANPKAQPKSATATKATAKDAAQGRKAGKPKRGQGRPKAKTAEELDAEMTDYFAGNSAAANAAAAATTNGAAAAAGEDAMDEIS